MSMPNEKTKSLKYTSKLRYANDIEKDKYFYL